MPANPAKFASRVLDAFAAAGNITDAQVTRANGPSTSTMTKLRKVAQGDESMAEPREPTWTKIDNAAGWVSGSARKVWRGEDPETVGGDTQDADYVSSPGPRSEPGISDIDVLAEVRAMRERLEALERALTRPDS